MRVEKDGVVVEDNADENKVVEAKTAKCPECGGKYLPQTGYCPKCKKKVGGKKKEEVETDDSAIEEGFKVGDKPKVDWDGPVTATITKIDGDEVTITRGKGDENTLVISKAELKDMLDSAPDKDTIDEENEIIEIPEEVKIPGTDVILEKGDKIQIVTEESEPEEAEPEENKE